MKVGVSTASLFLRHDNEDAVAVLDELGVGVAEIFFTSFSEYKPEFASLLKSNMGALNAHSVHILNTQVEPQLFNRHARVREDSFGILADVMRSAQVLGAKHYTFHGTARFKKASREPANDNLQRMGECIREIGEFCGGFGVKLCLENVEWATYNRVGVFTEMKKYYPLLQGVLDVKQARIAGEGYLPYLREMGESIATVHLSDVGENGKMCLPGQGKTDFETLVKALKDVGFDGPLLIEAYKDDYKNVSELKNSCNFLEEIVYKLQ